MLLLWGAAEPDDAEPVSDDALARKLDALLCHRSRAAATAPARRARTHTFMPPAPGAASGEVCQLTSAARGLTTAGLPGTRIPALRVG